MQELLEEPRVFAGLNYRRSRIEEEIDMNKDSKVQDLPLETPTDLASKATEDIAASLTTLLADTFALYLKTKNFHWHKSGRHFRDYTTARRTG